MNRAAFLDRDGVINRRAPAGEYITSWEEMEILPGVGDAIRLLNNAGFYAIVVTNQRSVGKGLITAPELEEIHRRMRNELECGGARVHDIYYCPHELRDACVCRKPEPGLLLQAAERHHINLTASWMIGDSDRDIEAGRRAGCRTVRLIEGDETESNKADAVARTLLEAVLTILRSDRRVVDPTGSGVLHDGTAIS